MAKGEATAAFYRFSLRRLLFLLGAVACLLASIKLAFLFASVLTAVACVASCVFVAVGLCGTWRWPTLVVLALAVGSYILGPTVMWHGGYPLVQVNVRFVDDHGRPIQSVQVKVFNERGESSPHRLRGEKTSDANGGVRLLSPGTGFGGETTYILGLAPIGARTPRPYVLFSHPEFHDYRVEFWSLVDEGERPWEVLPRVDIDHEMLSVDERVWDYDVKQVPLLKKTIPLTHR